MKEHREEIKKLEGMAEWHNQKAEELERQVSDIRALKEEARRHRREASAFAKKATQLRGSSGNEEEA